jgi:hypothetical protein
MTATLLAVLAPLTLLGLAAVSIRTRGGCEHCSAHAHITARAHVTPGLRR